MKSFLLNSLIIFMLSASALAAQKEILSKIDVSHPYYGNQTYGPPQINHFKKVDGSDLIVYQARYGGDGEHTENIVKIFEVTKSKPLKRYDANLSDVQFSQDSGVLKAIKGYHIETLCDVCDGWEVSSPSDIYKIPVEISINDYRVIVPMSAAEKEALLILLKDQIAANTKEQLSYRNSAYPEFVRAVLNRVTELLK